MKTPQERFHPRVNHDGPTPPHKPELGPCWPWTGPPGTWGYGSFSYRGRNHNASRIAYLFHYGQFDESKNVCHHCDNPACCRPSHLFLGTQRDNLEDCRKKLRDRYAHGEVHWNAKLTQQDIAQIQQLLHSNAKSHRQIAKDFNVSHSIIDGIARGTGWRHAITETYEALPKGAWVAGEACPSAKLANEDVLAIRAALIAGTSAGQLSRQYRVTRESIYGIRDRKTWRHI